MTYHHMLLQLLDMVLKHEGNFGLCAQIWMGLFMSVGRLTACFSSEIGPVRPDDHRDMDVWSDSIPPKLWE